MGRVLRLAGIELGGTKAIAVLAENHRIIEQCTLPTGIPDKTLEHLNAELRRWDRHVPLDGLGIASFGPIQLDLGNPDLGRILNTPKPGWSGADVRTPLTSGLTCPCAIDTDVNAAALAECSVGSAVGCESVCYITIGTGVGGGLVIGGRAVHGALHPEIGHLRLRRAAGDGFAGICPFHSDCIEGLVSGPALAQRFGQPAAQIPDDDPRWDHVAWDLGELMASIILAVSPERIVLGGSVALARANLLDRIRNHAVLALGDYLRHVDQRTIEEVVVHSRLGPSAGPLGAITLAESAAKLTSSDQSEAIDR
jgi:fructokinase